MVGVNRYSKKEKLRLLREHGAKDIPVIGGGIIPGRGLLILQEGGIRAVFTPGVPLESITQWIRENIQSKNLWAQKGKYILEEGWVL